MMEVPAKEGSEGGLLTQPSPERGAVVEGDSDSGSDHGGGSALDATGHPAGGAIAGRGCDSGALLTQAPDPDEGAAGSDEGAATCASGDGGSGYSSSVPSSSSSEEEDEEDEEGAALEKDLRAMTSSASGNGTPSIIRRRRRAIQRNQERMQVLFPRLERPGASGDARKRKRRRGPRGGGEPAYEGDAPRRRGMLFATSYNGMEPEAAAAGRASPSPSASAPRSAIDEICARYPHRHAQIRLLCGTFEGTLRQGAAMAARARDLDGDGLERCVPYVPPPVFVTGPSGTGKTSLVRDVLETLKRRHGAVADPRPSAAAAAGRGRGAAAPTSSVAVGCVNCSAIEGSTAAAFLEDAYKLILRSFFSSSADARASKPPKMSKRKVCSGGSPRKLDIEGGVRTSDLDTNALHTNEEEGCKGAKLGINKENSQILVGIDGNPSDHGAQLRLRNAELFDDGDHQDLDGDGHGMIDEDEDDDDMEDQIENQKKQHLRFKPSGSEQAQNIGKGQGTENNAALEHKRHPSINTMVEFGRALAPLCGMPNHSGVRSRQRGSAFLVLDHAERLLSMTAKQFSPYLTQSSSDRNNLLAQLLLLPKVLGLNLTIVVVTSNSLLEYSRTNNTHMQPSSSLGTIQDAIQPIRIRFHAYRGKKVFETILLLPKMKRYVVGQDDSLGISQNGLNCLRARPIMTLARDRFYTSMIKSIVQAMERSTRDTREMLRFARIFWPTYVSPLLANGGGSAAKIQKLFCSALESMANQGTSGDSNACDNNACMFCKAVATAKCGKGSIEKIVEMLDIKARKPMRVLMKKCLFTPIQKLAAISYPEADENPSYLRLLRSVQSSSLAQLSYMAKFLLLAAFLCQNNRQEQDLGLFTKEKKGRRRKTKRGTDNSEGPENGAYASSTVSLQQVRSLRRAAFPSERMISVFSSILSTHGSEAVVLQGEVEDDGYLNVSEVGSARLFECFAELRDFGLLCDMSGAAVDGSATIDMVGRKYTCSLSNQDAQEVAKDVGFPLQRYLQGS